MLTKVKPVVSIFVVLYVLLLLLQTIILKEKPCVFDYIYSILLIVVFIKL